MKGVQLAQVEPDSTQRVVETMQNQQFARILLQDLALDQCSVKEDRDTSFKREKFESQSNISIEQNSFRIQHKSSRTPTPMAIDQQPIGFPINANSQEMEQEQQSLAVVVRNRERKSGFQCPLSPAQVLSWVFAAFIYTSAALTLLCLFQRRDISKAKEVGLALLAVLYHLAFLGMVVMTVIVTRSDPTDPTVAFERLIKSQKEPDESATDAIQAIAEFYCNVCNAHVIEGSKHCQFCNRCSFEFDHHCRWISNDIGRLNYILFIRMLLFVQVTLILQMAVGFVAVGVDDYGSEEDQGPLLDYTHLIILNIFTLATTLMFLVLVTLLILFHFHLMRKSITTLQYLRRKQKRTVKSKVVTKVSTNKDQPDGVDEESKASKEKSEAKTAEQIFTLAEVFGLLKKRKQHTADLILSRMADLEQKISQNDSKVQATIRA